MRRPVDASRLRSFLQALGARAAEETRVYLTGGATAVLEGWRTTTIDVDLKMVPESEAMLRAIPSLKESLELNVELAAPDQFIPEVPGWVGRSPFIAREGRCSFYHYDFYSQALAKIERGHEKDLSDVREMLKRGKIDSSGLIRHFNEIEPQLYRYPAIDPGSFRAAVNRMIQDAAESKEGKR